MGEHLARAREHLEATLGGDVPEARRLDVGRAAVAELADETTLLGMLTELATGTETTAACARRSYRDTLGCQWRLLLVDGGYPYTLRLHAWRAAGPDERLDIHNHRSALASAVVRGELRSELYVSEGPGEGSADDGGVTVTAYREQLSADGADWLLVHRGPTRLRLVHTVGYVAGASYALGPLALHRAWCDPGSEALTLFLETGAERRPHTDVYSTAARHPTAVHKAALTEREFRSVLTALAASLTNTASTGGGLDAW
ncbi:hypothetical protein [Streptomyces sp. NPDC046925]|uniref:hypothetical protein n=1 Tax=Streptomyces sp. NPDC046925 TaxID=3155375 RepID=UPI0033D923E2